MANGYVPVNKLHLLSVIPTQKKYLGSKKANNIFSNHFFLGVMMERPALTLPIPREIFVSMEFTVLQV